MVRMASISTAQINYNKWFDSRYGEKSTAGKYLGMDPFEIYGLEEMYQRAGGGNSAYNQMLATGGAKIGLYPESASGLLSSQRALGVGAEGARKGARGVYGSVYNRLRGRGLSGANLRAESAFSSQHLLQAISGMNAMQALGGVGNFGNSSARNTSFINQMGNNFSPQQAGTFGQRIGQSTFSPGGGDAGQLFQMRAYGFGNPLLGAYQEEAKRVGIDPNLFKRRSFFEYKRFKEGDLVSKIQTQIVGARVEGRGNKEFQALMLSEQFNIPFTAAERLVGMADKGGLGAGAIQDVLGTAVGGSLPAIDKSRAASSRTGEALKLGNATAMKKVAEAMAQLQKIAIKDVALGIGRLNDQLSGLAKTFDDNKDLIQTGMTANIALVEALMFILSTASKLGNGSKD